MPRFSQALSIKKSQAELDFVDVPLHTDIWLFIDLRKIGAQRKYYKAAFQKRYPCSAPSVRMRAGELYRFLYELDRKHSVIYLSREDERVYVGRVVGEYEYRPTLNKVHPHVRKVRWIKKLDAKTLQSDLRRALTGRSALYQPGKSSAKRLREVLEITC